ncbi:type IV pilus biogenesis/stability protein PilW [Aerosakkonemataceae cyanobacterium BLCC-F154]|uniref:Type IV pilus biogenesis/stability protein PilW n=1 Tax=Floridaenema fluviatile BLCC-F154 TaxID=3153640 RepID=A0ABV4YCS6_9CYAN
MARIAYIPLMLSVALTTVGISVHPSVAQSTVQSASKTEVTLSTDEAQGIIKRADNFRQKGDLNKAIASLEGAIKDGNQTAAIYHKLGDLYLEAGRDLSEVAAAYSQAEKLAKAANNLPEQAAAQVALADVQFKLGKKEEANQLLNQAKQNYITLGDSESVSQVDAKITAIANDNNQGNFPRPVLRNGGEGR